MLFVPASDCHQPNQPRPQHPRRAGDRHGADSQPDELLLDKGRRRVLGSAGREDVLNSDVYVAPSILAKIRRGCLPKMNVAVDYAEIVRRSDGREDGERQRVGQVGYNQGSIYVHTAAGVRQPVVSPFAQADLPEGKSAGFCCDLYVDSRAG